MKRIIVAAVAAASLAGAAPANAQDIREVVGDVAAIKQPSQCVTPVTKCVDEAGDRAVALAMYYYTYITNELQKPPPIGTVCRLIWEEGCGTDAVPF